MIKAPYNFVPLSEKVFFPHWSEWVSHDIPFKDGESGEIEITITAQSPIFVGDSKEIADGKAKRFFNHNKVFYIPGSSIKGMVRNVLEIMSFSKMRAGEHDGNIDDLRYSFRDLSNKDYRGHFGTDKIHAGWLYKDLNGEYKIESCGIPGRVKHDEIDNYFGINFKNKFQRGNFNEQNNSHKTAEYKYKIFHNLLRENGKAIKNNYRFKFKKDDKGRKIYSFSQAGDEGTLVFSGQPSARNERRRRPTGKVYEFIFFKKKNPEILNISKEMFEDFKFIYFDGRDTEPKESQDWRYWKEKLYSGEKIPVFFKSENGNIKHFGLAYLYKLPYKHRVGDGVPEEHLRDNLDLAETIFGYTSEQDALKGRVQFSHAKATKNIKELNEVSLILGTPRASYYPFYLRQNGRNYVTYMDDSFRLSGWKRYPIHQNLTQTNDMGENDNVVTKFKPLNAGAEFEAKIRYHNLKKAEIGAILSALTFHGNSSCFHNIGLAKAFGYGKIKIDVKHQNINEYLREFELLMEVNIENWIDSPQLRELFTMATPQQNRSNSELEYMVLNPANRRDDFRRVKASKGKEYLKVYSKLDNIQAVHPQTLLGDEDNLEDYKERLSEEKKQADRAKDKRKKTLESEISKIDEKLREDIQALEREIRSVLNDKTITADEMIKCIEEFKRTSIKIDIEIEDTKMKYEEFLCINNLLINKIVSLKNIRDNTIKQPLLKLIERYEKISSMTDPFPNTDPSDDGDETNEVTFQDILETTNLNDLKKKLHSYTNNGSQKISNDEFEEILTLLKEWYKPLNSRKRKGFLRDLKGLKNFIGEENYQKRSFRTQKDIIMTRLYTFAQERKIKMAKLVITTVGTSIIIGCKSFYTSNGYMKGWNTRIFKLEKELEEKISKVDYKLNRGARDKLSIELFTLDKISLSKNDKVVLLTGDSSLSRLAATTLENIIKDVWNVETVIEKVEGLQASNMRKFREVALKNLVKLLDYYIASEEVNNSFDEIIINGVAGHRIFIPFLTIFSQLYRKKSIYVLETNNEIIKLSPIPMNVDKNIYSRVKKALEHLKDKELLEKDYLLLIENYKDSERDLFLSFTEPVGNGKIRLSPLAHILLHLKNMDEVLTENEKNNTNDDNLVEDLSEKYRLEKEKLEQEVQNLNNKISELLEKDNREIVELQKRLKYTESQMESIKNEKEIQDIILRDFQDRIEILTNQRDTCKSSKGMLNDVISKIEALKEKEKELKFELDKSQRINDSLNFDLKSCEEHLKEIKDEKDRLDLELENVKSKAKKRKKTIKKLKMKNRNYKDSILKYKNEIENLKSELNSFISQENENKTLKKEIAKIQKRLNELKEESNQKSISMENCKAKSQELAEQVEQLKSKESIKNQEKNKKPKEPKRKKAKNRAKKSHKKDKKIKS